LHALHIKVNGLVYYHSHGSEFCLSAWLAGFNISKQMISSWPWRFKMSVLWK